MSITLGLWQQKKRLRYVKQDNAKAIILLLGYLYREGEATFPNMSTKIQTD